MATDDILTFLALRKELYTAQTVLKRRGLKIATKWCVLSIIIRSVHELCLFASCIDVIFCLMQGMRTFIRVSTGSKLIV